MFVLAPALVSVPASFLVSVLASVLLVLPVAVLVAVVTAFLVAAVLASVIPLGTRFCQLLRLACMFGRKVWQGIRGTHNRLAD